jgi:hypothetical protein
VAWENKRRGKNPQQMATASRQKAATGLAATMAGFRRGVNAIGLSFGKKKQVICLRFFLFRR